MATVTTAYRVLQNPGNTVLHLRSHNLPYTVVSVISELYAFHIRKTLSSVARVLKCTLSSPVVVIYSEIWVCGHRSWLLSQIKNCENFY